MFLNDDVIYRLNTPWIILSKKKAFAGLGIRKKNAETILIEGEYVL